MTEPRLSLTIYGIFIIIDTGFCERQSRVYIHEALHGLPNLMSAGARRSMHQRPSCWRHRIRPEPVASQSAPFALRPSSHSVSPGGRAALPGAPPPTVTSSAPFYVGSGGRRVVIIPPVIYRLVTAIVLSVKRTPIMLAAGCGRAATAGASLQCLRPGRTVPLPRRKCHCRRTGSARGAPNGPRTAAEATTALLSECVCVCVCVSGCRSCWQRPMATALIQWPSVSAGGLPELRRASVTSPPRPRAALRAAAILGADPRSHKWPHRTAATGQQPPDDMDVLWLRVTVPTTAVTQGLI